MVPKIFSKLLYTLFLHDTKKESFQNRLFDSLEGTSWIKGLYAKHANNIKFWHYTNQTSFRACVKLNVYLN